MNAVTLRYTVVIITPPVRIQKGRIAAHVSEHQHSTELTVCATLDTIGMELTVLILMSV
jgi:hypothetical protein